MCNAKVSQAVRAHPRSRGENRAFGARQVEACGSSPLTRGKLAGQWLRQLIERAHPRSRGENSINPFGSRRGAGSSPLTRGKHRSTGSVVPEVRLIPAHAGKTPQCSRAPGPREAHPRSRGENRSGLSSATTQTGSSPLTRGKRVPPQGHGEAEGLIPAHAGKTMLCARRFLDTRAHPRSRGENIWTAAASKSRAGSSPLTRGKPHARRSPRDRRRLIPAHAGKTSNEVIGSPVLRAHPRSRGENSPTRP